MRLCMQVGPELEVPGYGCEDHFLELDTVEHSWEALTVGARAGPRGPGATPPPGPPCVRHAGAGAAALR